MFVCNKGAIIAPKRFRNTLVGRRLPLLTRSYISFHHLCGYDESGNVQAPYSCTVKLEKDQYQEEEQRHVGSEKLNRSIILTVPEARLSNDGKLSKIKEWFFEYRPLARINMNERIVLVADFDANYGGFGADNIHFHTPQR